MRRLSTLTKTRTKIDVAGFFILSGVAFAMSALQPAVLFLMIGAIVYVHDTLRSA